MTVAAITGVGTSLFGKQPDLHPVRAGVASCRRGAHHGRYRRVGEVDAVYVGTVFGAPGVAQRALHAMGMRRHADHHRRERMRERHHGAARGEPRRCGSDRFRTVLAVGVEKMTDQFAGAIHPGVDRHRRPQRPRPAEPVCDGRHPLPARARADRRRARDGGGEEPRPRPVQRPRPTPHAAHGRARSSPRG